MSTLNNTPTDFASIAHRYIAVWNTTDDTERRQLIDALWSADAQYIDPLAIACGRQEIDATMAAVQRQFQGAGEFTLLGDVDNHHDQARFQWAFGPAGGEPMIIGSDVAVRDSRGQLSLVLGFLDRVPS
ncbi:hypothetical protein [Tomitella biformata]|uniref:hypothetical protein n=1 Tax=Tomitella biformata TaxID=630403 RepID=UPI0004677074|nr:hypothetical protein [Tomitella biformata]